MREMKDSGVAWIGAVPSDFAISSIGSLFTIKKDIAGREPETVLSITQAGIKPKDLSSNEGQNASSYAHYQIVNVGDFAMNHMDLLTGWIDISKYEGVTSPDYRVFTLNDKKMSADYFLRVFQYYYTNRVFFGFGQGVATLGRWRLPAINFKKIDVPVPPISEQQRIVAAIDENVGKVDVLIENIQAQIEKLKAYKQSLIIEAVTKGLDPTVPLKDSGVDWIAKMPEHWICRPIKHFSKIHSGVLISKEEYIDNGKYPVIGANGEIGRFDKKNNNNKVITTGRVGSIGTAHIVEEAWITDNALILTVEGIDITYLAYTIPSLNFDLMSSTTAQPLVTASKLKQQVIPFPPFDEQTAIAGYLNKKCAQIDCLIALKQSKIEKLEQYKRSLIYEYVTGKREIS